MSLKAFHIVFITLSTLMTLGFAVWAVQQSLHGAGGIYWAMAVSGILGALGLPVYGVWFLKKTREVSFL